MKPLISIIVPIYNCEKYLSKCLETIMQQSYENIEIILVNDGSQDKSGEICKYYLERDNRIKYFENRNCGVSATRNLGLMEAKGDFFTFIDSDDYVENNYIEYLYTIIEENQADISMVGFVTEKQSDPKKVDYSDDIYIYNKKNLVLYNIKDFCCVCGKLFSRKCLNAGIRFDTKLYVSEDSLFVVEAFFNIERMVVSKSSLYHYVRHDKSTMATINLEKRYTAVIGWEKIQRYFDNYSSIVSKVKYYRTRECLNLVLFMKQEELNNEIIEEHLLHIMKSNIREFLYYEKRIGTKMSFLVIVYFTRLFNCLVTLYKRKKKIV